jgi:Mg-chelatase subunit ChlD
MFQTSEIQFHTDNNNMLYKHSDLNQKVGVLQLHVKTADVQKNPIYVLFSVDCSASMSETIYNHPSHLNSPRPKLPHTLDSSPEAFFGLGSLNPRINSSENNTKMSQLIYTLKRIFKEFAKESEKNGVEIHVAVMGFEHKLHSIVEFIQITQENVDELIKQLDTIESKTSTNIEKALKYAQKTLAPYLESDTNRVYHIFMTDGQITSGESRAEKLQKYVDTRYSTTFVGFGKQHDSTLLIELSNYLRGEYYFIDKIENSGLVYGEIVYNIIYLAIDAIQLNIRNGLIYNWKNNQWTSEITLANISNDCEKILHLTTYGNIHDVEIDICRISKHTEQYDELFNEVIDTIYCYPPLLNIEHMLDLLNNDPISIAKLDTEKKTIEPVNLSKYHFRQKTQELLFETRKIKEDMKENIPSYNVYRHQTNTMTNHDIDYDLEIDTDFCVTEELRKHKCKLREFLKDILDFMKANMLTEDMFMRRLGDDIYVLYNTFDRSDAQMWCTSRQVSQGRQQTYTASKYENNVDIDNNISLTPRFGRQRKFWSETNFGCSRDFLSESDEISDRTCNLWDESKQINIYDDEPEDDGNTTNVDFWNSYRIGEDNLDLSTATPNMVNMMMSISTDDS